MLMRGTSSISLLGSPRNGRHGPLTLVAPSSNIIEHSFLPCQGLPTHVGVMSRLFGEKLLALRLRHSLTQVQLAQRIQIKQAHISNVEGGQRLPSLEFVLAVSRAFQVSVDYLLRDDVATDTIDNHPAPHPAPTQAQAAGDFGEKLYHLRVANKLTQDELAQKLGLSSRGYVSNLESGRKQPSLELVPRIADFFGVTTDYLLRDDIPVEPPAAPEQ